jgi:hypothetical protein
MKEGTISGGESTIVLKAAVLNRPTQSELYLYIYLLMMGLDTAETCRG